MALALAICPNGPKGPVLPVSVPVIHWSFAQLLDEVDASVIHLFLHFRLHHPRYATSE